MTELTWEPSSLVMLLRLPAPRKAFLRAIDSACGDPPRWIRYTPAVWRRQRPTEGRRQRWSRWTRQLERDGQIERQTELHRDRVTHVRITVLGREIARPTLRMTDAGHTGLQRHSPAVNPVLAPIDV